MPVHVPFTIDLFTKSDRITPLFAYSWKDKMFLKKLINICYGRSRIIKENSKMEIYVGNLPWSTSDQDLADAFGAFGKVEKASIISDRNSGRSKGFGFVTMEDADEANKAIESMNGSEMGGRNLKVNEARPREDRPPRQSNW